MKQPFLKALPILDQIEQAGFEAYFVGGSVRDYLLNRSIHDIDIATSATPDEIKGIFHKTVDVGIAHGTVIVLFHGEPYEVTTFRSESEYNDFRRPNEVTFIRSLEEDLKRRDFTMNAIAMDKSGQMIDHFHGQADIQNKVIKTVGKAEERFREDALRMMRAVRFMSQLSFQVDQSTLLALHKYSSLLEHIAIERITIEFEKLLVGDNLQQALSTLIEAGLYKYLPGFQGRENDLMSFLSLSIDTALSIEERWILLLFQFRKHPENVEPFLRNWKLPLIKIKRVQKGLYWLEHRLNSEWTTEDLYSAKREFVISTEKLYNVIKNQTVTKNIDLLDQKLSDLPIEKRSDLALTGKDLIDWFQKDGGPWVEEKLLQIEKAVLNKEVNNCREAIREWLFRCNQS